MEKRMFQILDEMNKFDEVKNTQSLGVCSDIISVDKHGKNGRVTVGVPGNIAQELITSGKKRAILLIVDMEAYEHFRTL